MDQLEAFPGADLDATNPKERWLCTRCGSNAVLGVSRLDTSERYAIAARCAGCHKTRVMVVRDKVTVSEKPL